MRRSDRYINTEKCAEKHINKMNLYYEDDIKYSVDNSVVYRDINNIYNNPEHGNENMAVSVVGCKTDDAIFMFNSSDNVCALNFASYKYPGGGFIKGSLAQEEALCHVSTLYNVISDDRFKSAYEYNRQNTNGGLYEHFAIYSPNIVFENSKYEKQYADVITCPAPNISFYRGTIQRYKQYLRERIKMVLDIAASHNVKVLILGAFGCGVFKNDPFTVAETFKDILYNYNYNFDNVVFAIPYGYNNNAFKSVFK